MSDLAQINQQVVDCVLCPRLVNWRTAAATDPPARFRGQDYWARPVPGFGDAAARVLLVGLAPAAHGANRTGRMFTGDRSGDFLYPVLHKAGFANQPTSIERFDGLALNGLYISAINRCAPPANKPTPSERDNCLPYLAAEIEALSELRVIVALGAFAWDGSLRALAGLGHVVRPRPVFGHGREATVGHYVLLGSFHPSQQNTFTGRLTPAMLAAVVVQAQSLAQAEPR